MKDARRQTQSAPRAALEERREGAWARGDVTAGKTAGKPAAIGLLLLLVMMAGGCAVKPGVIFPEVDGPKWPPPPDESRIAYVGKLETSADLKPGMNGLEALGQAIFGKEPAHSMLTPIALCTDNGNRLFVVDSNAQLVHVFDLMTRVYQIWKPGKGMPALSQPVGIAWDGARQRLLVSDPVAGTIFVFDNAGQYVGQMGEGILQRPVGLAVEAGGKGRIFVADAEAHQVVVLAADGKLERRIGQRGAGAGEFNYPTNVALDRDGLLYVSDSLNFRVQQFDAELNFARTFGKKGDLPGYFAEPKGIATDSEGHVYVVDGQFENVQIFDGAGNVLMDFGQEGTGPGEFWLPTALYVDGHDRLWVADSYNRRVQVFDYKKAESAAATTSPQPQGPQTREGASHDQK